MAAKFVEYFSDAYFWHVIYFTVLQATLSTVFSLLIALPAARALAHRHFIGKKSILLLMQFLWMLPNITVVLGLVIVYGKQGWLKSLLNSLEIDFSFSLYGLPGILLAHLFLDIPLAMRLIFNELIRIPGESWRLAAQLAMSPYQAFRFIEWPQIKAPILGIACLIFLLCFQGFTLILALGGGPRASTIEVAIYHAVRFDFDFEAAFYLALWQVSFCLTITSLSFSFVRKSLSYSTIGLRQTTSGIPKKISPTNFINLVTQHNRSAFLLDILSLAVTLLFLLPPFAAILFSGINATFSKIIASETFWISFGYSLSTALCTGALSIFLSLSIAFYLRHLRIKHKRFFISTILETISISYLIIPPTILSMLLFFLFNSLSNKTLLGFYAIIFINSLMALPFALRSLTYSSQEILEKYNKLYRSLGLSFWQRWKFVEAPLLRKNISHALALSVILALGNFSVIAFFGSASLQTLPYMIYTLLGSYQLEEAAVVVLCLILLSILLLIIIDRVVGGKNAANQ